MPADLHDTFPSPYDARHQYVMPPVGEGLDNQDLTNINDITIVTIEGAETYTASDVQVDRFRVHPKLGKKSLADSISNANARWSLVELDVGDKNA